MTEQEQYLLDFIKWMETKDIYVCGLVGNWMLGTDQLTELAHEDRSNLIRDFLAQRETK